MCHCYLADCHFTSDTSYGETCMKQPLILWSLKAGGLSPVSLYRFHCSKCKTWRPLQINLDAFITSYIAVKLVPMQFIILVSISMHTMLKYHPSSPHRQSKTWNICGIRRNSRNMAMSVLEVLQRCVDIAPKDKSTLTSFADVAPI